MIQFTGTDPETGRQLVGFGLSTANITYLQAGRPIRLRLEDMGLDVPLDVVLFAGTDENTMATQLNIGPDTVIHDDYNRGGG